MFLVGIVAALSRAADTERYEWIVAVRPRR